MAITTSMQNPNRRGWPVHRRVPRRRLAAGALVVAVMVASVIAPGTAGADEVTDLEARAARIADELMNLQTRIGEIGEQFNQSQVRLAEIAESRADLEQRSRVARLEMEARRADAARYAMSAYVGLDEGDVLSMALDGRQWDLSRRTGYAAIRIGDREQVVDQLRAAEQANDDLLDALAEADRAEQRIAADLERSQAEATRLIAEQEQLQNSVQGELADAVARRQAQIAAARQAETAPGTTTGDAAAPGGPATAPPSVAGPAAPVTPGAPATQPAGPGTPTTRPAAPPPPSGGPGPTSPPATAPPPPPPPVAPPTTGRGATAANAAISQLGVRYSWGGGNASGPSMGFGPGAGIVGFDCSGLTLYAWARAGVSLPHSAQMQYNLSAKVGLGSLAVGDLVFYGTSASNITHVAIYVGGGQVVHAPNSRSVVQYGAVNLWNGYYSWIGAGRPG